MAVGSDTVLQILITARDTASSRIAAASARAVLAQEKVAQAQIRTEAAATRLAAAQQKMALSEEKAGAAAQGAAAAEDEAGAAARSQAAADAEDEIATDGLKGALEGLKFMAGQLALQLAITGVQAALALGQKAVQASGLFQQAMLKNVSQAGLAKDKYVEFSNKILQMAPQVGKAPLELAKSLYFVLSNGIPAGQALDVVRLSAHLAAEGMTDSAITAKAMTMVMNNMGMTAQQAANYIIKAVADGNTTMDQFAKTIGKLGLDTHMAGRQANETGAALDVLTYSFKSTATAGTGLSALYTAMDIKTSTMISKASALGISIDKQRFKSMTLTQQIDFLNNATHGNSEELLKMFNGSKLAVQAFEALAAHGDKYKKILDDLKQAQKEQAEQQAWKTTEQGWNQMVAQFKAGGSALLITLGNAILPPLTLIGQKILPIINGLMTWTQNSGLLQNASKGLTRAINGISDAIGSVIGWIGRLDWSPIRTGLSNLKNTIGGIAVTLFQPLRDAFTNLFKGGGKGPDIGQMLGKGFKQAAQIIGQVMGSINNALKHIDLKAVSKGIKQVIDIALEMNPAVNLFQALSSHAKELGKWVQTSLLPALRQAGSGFKDLGKGGLSLFGVLKSVADALHNMNQKIMGAMIPVYEKIIPMVIKLAGAIAGGLGKALQFLAPYIAQAATALGQFGGEVATRVAPILLRFFNNISEQVQNFLTVWNAVWPYLAPILKGVWDEIVGVIKIAWSVISGMFLVALDLLSGNWSGAWNDFKQVLVGVWSGIQTFLHGAMEMVVGTIKPLIAALANVPGPAGDMARSLLKAFNQMDQSASSSTKHTKATVTAHMLEMKAISLMHIAQMHMQSAAHFEQMRQKLITQIKNTKDPVAKHALEMKLAVLTHTEEMHKKAAEHAQLMAHGVTEQAAAMQDKMVGHSIIPDMVTSIIAWFAKLPGETLQAVGSLAGQMGTFFGNLATQAITWGSNLIKNFISGLTSQLGNVGNAAGQIMSKVANFLKPGSPTKEGIGKTLMTWGPRVGQIFAAGLAAQAGLVGNSAGQLMTAASSVKNTKVAATQNINQQITAAQKQIAAIKALIKALEAAHKGHKHTKAENAYYQQVLANDRAKLKLLNKSEHALEKKRKAGLGKVSASGTGSSSGGSAGAYSGGSGGGNVYNTFSYTFNFTVPMGTSREFAREVTTIVDAELAKKQRRKGQLPATSGSVG